MPTDPPTEPSSTAEAAAPPEWRPGFYRHNWHWTAHYDDGTTLQEFGPDRDHGFGEIDLARVRAFELDPTDPASGRPAFCVLIDPARDQQPIFFRREASNSMYGEPGRHLMTCVGRKDSIRVGQKRHVRHVFTYVFFDDDGHVLIADTRDPEL